MSPEAMEHCGDPECQFCNATPGPPPPRYFLRHWDPLQPVYQVDFEAGTWKLAASRIGAVEGSEGRLADGGHRFLEAGFREVWPAETAGAVIRFVTERPVMGGATP